MTKTKELRCCLGCGRDTHGEYCPRCLGHGDQADKGRRARATGPDLPLEDDYSEESDADSVCVDDSALVSRI